jgi:hypothetical protein
MPSSNITPCKLYLPLKGQLNETGELLNYCEELGRDGVSVNWRFLSLKRFRCISVRFFFYFVTAPLALIVRKIMTVFDAQLAIFTIFIL